MIVLINGKLKEFLVKENFESQQTCFKIKLSSVKSLKNFEKWPFVTIASNSSRMRRCDWNQRKLQKSIPQVLHCFSHSKVTAFT